MHTILIAQRDAPYSEYLAAELRAAGYRVIGCPGPLPPAERCIRCDVGFCPLTEGADLLIYDPELSAVDPRGERENLALESALAHPDVPMLLAWPPDHTPHAETLQTIHARAPHVHAARREPSALVHQIQTLIARPLAVGVAQ
jgi:hypothetical protein